MKIRNLTWSGLLIIGEYRELNRGTELDMCDLLGFLCVGMGSLFNRVNGDLGRIREEDMTFEGVSLFSSSNLAESKRKQLCY